MRGLSPCVLTEMLRIYIPRKDIQMRISVKMVLLVVCVSAGLVFGAAKNAKDVKVEPKDTKAAVTPAKETAVKPEVKEAKPAAPAVKAAEPNAAAENTGVAVTVNGKDIMEADVDAKMNAYRIEQYKRPQMVESMVMEQLLEEQIKKAGVNVTDNDVNDKLNEYIAAQPGMTMEVLKARVTSQGQSFEQIKEQIKKTVSYEKLIGNVEVNDAEAKAFYDENKEDFNKPEQVRASHILIKTSAGGAHDKTLPVSLPMTPEEKAVAKTKIEDLLKQVKAGGDFAALAKENSDDPGSKIAGGDLGFFDRSTMVKEFADAAFATKVGEVSGVIETQFGYHIIKVTDHKEGGLMPFDKAQADIVKLLQNKKKSELFKQLIEKIKAQAKIVYPPGKEPKPRMPMMPQGQRPNGQAPQSESAPMSK